MAQGDIILAEAQMIAIERKKGKQEGLGEIETEHPDIFARGPSLDNLTSGTPGSHALFRSGVR